MSSADDCIFCAIVAGDAPAQLIDSDEHTIAFMDIAPATKGHALVIPRNHSADLTEIPADDLQHTIVAAQRLTEKLKAALDPAGFNILNACGSAAWQTVFHFHLHVIPRYEGDPLQLPTRPRQAESQELAEVAAALRG